MIVTAILTVAVVWCLFYGALPPVPLGFLCVALGAALALLGRHKHGGALSIDVLAQRSRLNRVNAPLKVWGCVVLLICCVSSHSPILGLGLAVIMLAVTVLVGGVRLHEYLSLLALPAAFLLVSGLALLVSFHGAPEGVLNVRLFGVWCSVTPADQARTALVLSKALGAVSCLYLLSLSTPMTEIIAALRKARVPAVIVELMYLIYRYIFILLEMHRTMRDAAESRLGYVDFRVSVRTTGNIYANLLAHSFHKANLCFDAMESRCYEGEIRFLEDEKPVTVPHGLAAGLLLAATASMSVATYFF